MPGILPCQANITFYGTDTYQKGEKKLYQKKKRRKECLMLNVNKTLHLDDFRSHKRKCQFLLSRHSKEAPNFLQLKMQLPVTSFRESQM